MEYEVFVLCPKNSNEVKCESIEGVNVLRINKSFCYRVIEYLEEDFGWAKNRIINKILRFLRYSNLFIHLPIYPVQSIYFAMKNFEHANTLYEKNKFDAVVSTCNLIEGVIAGILLKKKYHNIKFCLYALDSLSNRGAGQYLSKNFIDKKGWFWEKNIYKHADLILNVKCHEKHYAQSRYELFREKMQIVDFPLFKEPEISNLEFHDNNDNKTINFVYSGSLYCSFRNPKYICDTFALINSNQYVVSFYSRGDSEELLKEYESRTFGIIRRKGFIERQKLEQVTSHANFLISIGNSNTDMVPSKIFEYMSTGKPIIHFYSDENDSCLPYYKKYPLALLVKEDYSILSNNAKNIKSFIANSVNVKLSYEDIMNIFSLNTPIYTANIIDRTVKNVPKG